MTHAPEPIGDVRENDLLVAGKRLARLEAMIERIADAPYLFGMSGPQCRLCAMVSFLDPSGVLDARHSEDCAAHPMNRGPYIENGRIRDRRW